MVWGRKRKGKKGEAKKWRQKNDEQGQGLDLETTTGARAVLGSQRVRLKHAAGMSLRVFCE